MAKFTVEVVPVSGAKRTEEVEMDATGATVGEVLKKAGISPDNMQLSINGEPATTASHLPKGAKVSAKIEVTERARGS